MVVHPYDGILHNDKTHELQLQTTTCTNLKSIMLSERRQMQKATILKDCIYMKFRKRQNYKDRNKISGYQGWGMGEKTVYKRQDGTS